MHNKLLEIIQFLPPPPPQQPQPQGQPPQPQKHAEEYLRYDYIPLDRHDWKQGRKAREEHVKMLMDKDSQLRASLLPARVW